MKKFFYLAIVVSIFSSCSKDDSLNEDYYNDNNNEGYKIVASLDNQATTRLAGTDNSNSTDYIMNFAWVSDDSNKARFMYNKTDGSAREESLKPASAGSTTTFSLGAKPATNSYIYGCTSVNDALVKTFKFTNTGATYDAAQVNIYVQCEKCIATTADDIAKLIPMYGVIQENSTGTAINNTMTFRNVCPLVKFTVTLPDDVTSIKDIRIKGYSGPGDVSKGRAIMIRKNLVGTGSSKTFAFSDTDYDDTHKKTTGEYYATGKTYTPTDHVLTFYVVMIPQNLDGLWVKLTGSTASGDKTYTNWKLFDSQVSLVAGKMYGVKVTKASSWTVTTP